MSEILLNGMPFDDYLAKYEIFEKTTQFMMEYLKKWYDDNPEDFQKEMNPYTNGLPDSVSEAWNKRMKSFFELFLKHSDIITRVTVWGVCDGDSWKNNFPVRGRTDYPLLFDRNHQIKPFLKELAAENKKK